MAAISTLALSVVIDIVCGNYSSFKVSKEAQLEHLYGFQRAAML